MSSTQYIGFLMCIIAGCLAAVAGGPFAFIAVICGECGMLLLIDGRWTE